VLEASNTMTSKGKPALPSFDFKAIGVARTPFTQRFGIPRQPGLVPEAKGILKMDPNPDFKHALKTLNEFTHLWVIWVFHDHGGKKWKPTIRPPRLGGKAKVGVLSSRSPHRPNPIGLSVVKIERIDLDAKGGAEIHVQGVDLMDGTPILDIKPYLPYADSVPDAGSGWAHEEIKKTPVHFEPLALKKIAAIEAAGSTQLKDLIEQLITIDPRPGFQKTDLPPDADHAQGTDFGLLVKEYDVKWKIENHEFVVYDLEYVGRIKKPKPRTQA
jgi:tRNA-Thr(GGU) m(6)t(6)A37 methyltransferase TsaA